MIERDPNLILYDVLRDGFDNSNTSLATAPNIHTGWYDYAAAAPQITVTNAEDSVVNGGATGYTGATGAGGGSQVRAGTALVNCWAGRRSDLKGAGTGGADLNPKAVSWEMAKEASRVLNASADGTTNPTSGNREFNSVAADGVRLLVETEQDHAIYRREITARYTFIISQE